MEIGLVEGNYGLLSISNTVKDVMILSEGKILSIKKKRDLVAKTVSKKLYANFELATKWY